MTAYFLLVSLKSDNKPKISDYNTQIIENKDCI